jgi:uncharacterized protein (TIGR00297 family)
MEVLTLSGTGLAVAAAMAVLFVLFGWQAGWLFIVGMVLFLVLSALVTWCGRDYKRKKNLGQDARGVRNVMANGSVPLLLAGLYRLSLAIGADRYAVLCLFGFIAAVAAITADKFASEIGVLDGMPVSLLGRKIVRKGVSGGVTWVGLAVSALAAGLVGAVLIPLSMPYGLSVNIYLAVGIVTLCGFVGSLVDSVLGYYEERGIGSKFSSNLACSAAGALLGVVLIMIL